MRILALDIGNSRATIGVFEDDELVAREDVSSKDFVPELIHSFRADLTVISCVSAAHRTTVEALLSSNHAVQLCASHSPVDLHYDYPERLGADRIANVIAARQISPGGAVVVDLGTATHFDICGADGSFYGGPILPGLATMTSLLTARIPHLPQVGISSDVLGECSPVVSRTEHGIQTGCIYGTAGAVERICSEITRQMGPLPVILTGGNARGIAPIVRHDVCDPDLTLRGLYLFGADFQKNCQCMGESTE